VPGCDVGDSVIGVGEAGGVVVGVVVVEVVGPAVGVEPAPPL